MTMTEGRLNVQHSDNNRNCKTTTTFSTTTTTFSTTTTTFSTTTTLMATTTTRTV